jgi:hypothetical protein
VQVHAETQTVFGKRPASLEFAVVSARAYLARQAEEWVRKEPSAEVCAPRANSCHAVPTSATCITVVSTDPVIKRTGALYCAENPVAFFCHWPLEVRTVLSIGPVTSSNPGVEMVPWSRAGSAPV